MTDKSRKVFFDYLSAKLSPTWGDYGTTIIIDELWADAWQAATSAADAKYLPVIEKLVEALEFAKIKLNDFRGCIYDRDDDDIKTQEKIAEALALAEPLLEKKGEV